MKESKTKRVEVVITYNAGNSSKSSINAKVVSPQENEPSKNELGKLGDNHKLVRRYSYDDNGGGYLGL